MIEFDPEWEKEIERYTDVNKVATKIISLYFLTEYKDMDKSRLSLQTLRLDLEQLLKEKIKEEFKLNVVRAETEIRITFISGNNQTLLLKIT